MNRRGILLVSIIVVLLLSVLCVIFPPNVGGTYASVMQPLSLFVGFILALKVSSYYQKALKKSFFFLSLFFALYMVSNILGLWQFLYSHLGNAATLDLIQILQLSSYAMLITSCIYTLKVIEVKRIARYGWIFIGVMVPVCVYIVIRGLPSMAVISANPQVEIVNLLVRIFDMAIILMLVPVIILYIQHLKAKAQESVPFTIIMGGLIFSIISTYIYQMATGLSLNTIATDYFQKGSALDTIYLFGYCLMIVGLYANIKYSEWGYKAIEKALG